MRRLLLLLLVAAACCTTPPILDPHVVPGQCNIYTEHGCAGGGCCLNSWQCGGQQPDQPMTCPDGYCCDEETNPHMAGHKPPQHQRQP